MFHLLPEQGIGQLPRSSLATAFDRAHKILYLFSPKRVGQDVLSTSVESYRSGFPELRNRYSGDRDGHVCIRVDVAEALLGSIEIVF